MNLTAEDYVQQDLTSIVMGMNSSEEKTISAILLS